MSDSSDALLAEADGGAIFLNPGGIHCAALPTVVTTILGSCVAVCLLDSLRQLGGINHFVLPHRNAAAQNARFGDVAIDRLVDGMVRLGSSVDRLRAKVFGGAAVLPCSLSGTTVGEQNVQVALERLHSHGIPVVVRRTGGNCGLFIRLHTATGEVLVRRLAQACRNSGPRGACNG